MLFAVCVETYRKRHVIQHVVDTSRQISLPVKNTPYKVSKHRVKDVMYLLSYKRCLYSSDHSSAMLPGLPLN